MEVVGGVASLITIVGVGLTAATSLRQILSDVKEGPAILDRTIRDVSDLEEALSSIKAIAKRVDEDDRLSRDHGQTLRRKLLVCSEDLKDLSSRLGKLSLKGNDGKWEQLKKNAKTVIHGENISKMRGMVRGHSEALNLQITALQGVCILDVRQQQREHDIELLAATQASQSSLGKLEAGMGRLASSVLQANAPMGQINEILEILRRLDSHAVGQISMSHQFEATASARDDASDEGQQDSKALIELMEKVANLSKLVKSVEKDGFPEDSSETLHELRTSLIDVFGKLATDDFKEAASTSTELNHHSFKTLQQDSDRLRSAVHCTYGMAIGSGAVGARVHHETTLSLSTTPQNTSHLPTRKQRIRTSFEDYNFGIGTVRICRVTSSRTSKHPYRTTSSLVATTAREGDEEDTTFEITFVPNRPGSILKVFLSQFRRYLTVNTTIPTLTVRNSLPSSSEVFTIVETGRVLEFRQLLQDGAISIHDCDEYGTPFLHYAFKHPRMCRFLVDHGSDINYVAPLPTLRSRVGTILSPLSYHRNYIELLGLFLTLGADPTVPENGRIFKNVSPWRYFLKEKWIKTLLDAGAPFVDVNSTTTSGTPMLHVYLSQESPTLEGLDELLKRGADVAARREEGSTCLMSLFRNRVADAHEILACAKRLIEKGASIFETDHNGRSATQIAYDAEFDEVWDRLLVEYGHSVSAMRTKYRATRTCGWGRPGSLIRRPLRSEFEQLWLGMETHCPYYNHVNRQQYCPWDKAKHETFVERRSRDLWPYDSTEASQSDMI